MRLPFTWSVRVRPWSVAVMVVARAPLKTHAVLPRGGFIDHSRPISSTP
jgi:hypothetical protein